MTKVLYCILSWSISAGIRPADFDLISLPGISGQASFEYQRRTPKVWRQIHPAVV
jgi:hypothetical protein